MYEILIFGLIVCMAIFLVAITVGHNLFSIMVDEQIRYLRLIVSYAPLPETPGNQTLPEPVARYLSWATGPETKTPGCAHIRYTGRIRFGKTGRWMGLSGDAFYSLAVPGFVWHATIAYAPGIWLEAFDYYVHHKAGMNLNLFSTIPLNNATGTEILPSSLFRYLASAPLFPRALVTAGQIRWEYLNDSAAKAMIHDAGLSVEAIVRFNGKGWIESITTANPVEPGPGHNIPGVFACRFSGYSPIGDCQIPTRIFTEHILPDGQYLCMECRVTDTEFDLPEPICPEVS